MFSCSLLIKYCPEICTILRSRYADAKIRTIIQIHGSLIFLVHLCNISIQCLFYRRDIFL